MESLVLRAPAKVNLFLGVGELRPDGFHAVRTILHALALADAVTLTPADELTLECDTDLGIPAEKNLAYRAAAAFSEAFDVDVLLDIHVAKRIPSGAGLGGGSSDAAAVLAGLAYWSSMALDDPRLLGIARSLGADVPFFFEGGAALMEGRGDVLATRLPALRTHIALVKPPAPVPTAQAYRCFDAAPVPADDVRGVTDALRAADADALAASLSNNLTASSAALVPEIAEALAWLGDGEGVLGAAMAGSGSAVFAICRTAADAERIAFAAHGRGWWGTATSTVATGVEVVQGGGDAA